MEGARRIKKTFKINHTEPGEFRLGYILLPVGYSYNAAIAQAKKGDTLRLFDGGEYPILVVRKMKMKDPNTDILCRMRYGITLKGALMRWKNNARLEGHGSQVVSEDECLWIIYADREDTE